MKNVKGICQTMNNIKDVIWQVTSNTGIATWDAVQNPPRMALQATSSVTRINIRDAVQSIMGALDKELPDNG